MTFSEPSKLLVRAATLAEAVAVAALLRQAFLVYEPHYTPAAFAATTPTAEQLRQRWHEGPVWVALLAHELAGTIAAVPQTHGLYLRSMAVHPQARGQGLGNALLANVEAYARDHGFRRMHLSTTPFLTNAIWLYERFGFVRTSDDLLELCGTPLFTMEKLLELDEECA
ncbi:MAG: GNAT family N-acetyltransferase [Acidobacteria bacterium]|nr:GNAT family N-acetyltransferase [Acidobacteriota bacterium]MBI3425737.1 GNAT family N-acetyltransferase [Acidobacteriota bacterium]